MVEEDKDLTLEDGIQIRFEKDNNKQHEYRTGDYWLIPARTATGDVEWPKDENEPQALPPHGVEHHYAPLAIISVNNDGSINETPTELRRTINKLGT